MLKKHKRYKVVESIGHYSVHDLWTARSKVLSDGVDVVPSKVEGKYMRPGSQRFVREWERILNDNPAETEEAYFG